MVSKSNRVNGRKSNKEEGEKPYLNWRGYDISFNCWIDIIIDIIIQKKL